jgi:hypothetical protein
MRRSELPLPALGAAIREMQASLVDALLNRARARQSNLGHGQEDRGHAGGLDGQVEDLTDTLEK